MLNTQNGKNNLDWKAVVVAGLRTLQECSPGLVKQNSGSNRTFSGSLEPHSGIDLRRVIPKMASFFATCSPGKVTKWRKGGLQSLPIFAISFCAAAPCTYALLYAAEAQFDSPIQPKLLGGTRQHTDFVVEDRSKSIEELA
jgi:hypothetical protein